MKDLLIRNKRRNYYNYYSYIQINGMDCVVLSNRIVLLAVAVTAGALVAIEICGGIEFILRFFVCFLFRFFYFFSFGCSYKLKRSFDTSNCLETIHV